MGQRIIKAVVDSLMLRREPRQKFDPHRLLSLHTEKSAHTTSEQHYVT